MRIDDIEIGAEYTDDRTHYASDVRPRRYRADAVDTIPGTTRRAVLITELDPETGTAIPTEAMVDRGGPGYSYQDRSRTATHVLAKDLEPYGPALDAWVCWTAAYADISATAKAIKEALDLDPDSSRVRPVVVVTTGGLVSRVDLELPGETARDLADLLAFAQLAREAS